MILLLAEVAKWQTQLTQNQPRFTPHVGSTPTTGTTGQPPSTPFAFGLSPTALYVSGAVRCPKNPKIKSLAWIFGSPKV